MLLTGKTGLILGVANRRSLAWAAAGAVAREGARLALSCRSERIEENVRELARQLDRPLLLRCDVTQDADLDRMAETLRRSFGTLDFVIHAVAFAQRDDLAGRFLDTTRAGYHLAQDVSSYSLTAVARRVAPLMEGADGSIVTLTYLGGQRVVPHYNVMGVAKAALDMSVRYLAADLGPQRIRVNAISAGPVRTLAASGIRGLSRLLSFHRTYAPLRRNTSLEDIGNAALFLVSHLSRGVTGEVIHVDNGFHVLGLPGLDPEG
jgi:enoyl-[acyl-carrier protein] reductase I